MAIRSKNSNNGRHILDFATEDFLKCVFQGKADYYDVFIGVDFLSICSF